MSAASFVAGWLACGLFVIVGATIQAQRRRRRERFATTSQFMTDLDELEAFR